MTSIFRSSLIASHSFLRIQMFICGSEKNPFEFLTGSDMLIDQWYGTPKF